MKLKDKVAIITGTTKGIGVALAKEYAKAGAKVVGTGRSLELGEQVAAEIRAAGGESIFVPCDVSKKADVDRVIAETLKAFGTVDIVVNNAGVNHAADFFAITEEDWDWVMGVDLKGAFLMSQAGARVMVEQGKPGYIVNISSIMAKMALRNQVAYCAAKGGVNQLTTAMGLALIDKGIRVNCVAPGPVLTELMQRVVHNQEKHEELMRRLPIGYIAAPEEIASVCIFLSCDEASYMVGQTVYVDGGRGIQAFPRALDQ
ncbi:MAG: SDR family oxidoreductase [Caldilineales bacterium]|nr:SDR family oxidoreductase [Caldilineales bacterium]